MNVEYRLWIFGVAVAIAGCLTGCAGAGDTTGSGGEGGSGAGSTGSGAGSTGSGGAVPAGVVSNTPGAEYADVSPSPATGLVLVSMNFVQEDSAGQTYQQWFAEIRNLGTGIYCFVQLNATYKDANGAALAEVYGFTNAKPYDLGGTLTKPCLAPGEAGVLYDNGFAGAPVALGSVSRVEYSFDYLQDDSSKLHPLTPTIASANVVTTFGPEYLAVSGTVQGSGGSVYNVGMDVYPVNAEGLIFDQLMDFHLDTLPAGASWSYETTSTDAAPFSTFRQFIDFLPDGGGAPAPKSAPPPSWHAPGASESRYGALAAQLRTFRARRDENRAFHRAGLGVSPHRDR